MSLADDRKRFYKSRPRISKYQWPADKLTEYEMGILYKWRVRTSTPINTLLKQAVIELDKIIERG